MKTTTVLIRDSFDDDMYHIGYTFQSKLTTKDHHRMACNIHFDDIAGVFGEDMESLAKSISPGEWEIIEIKAN